MKQEHHSSGLARVTAGVLAAGLIGSACFAQAPADTRNSGVRNPARTIDARPEPLTAEALAARLRDRLEEMDALRGRIASMIEGLESGADPGDLLGPEDRRRLGIGWGPLDGPPGDIEPRGRGESGLDRGPGRRGGPSSDEPGGGGFDRERPREHTPTMSDEQLSEIRAIIDEHIPMLAERLKAAETKDPEAAARFFGRVAPRFRDILELRERAPELVEVRIDEVRTGMAIVAAARELRRLHEGDPEGAAFAAKKLEIRGLLAKQLELRDRLERDRLGRQIAELEAEMARLEDRSGRHGETIDDHLTRVLERTLRGDNGRPGGMNGRGMSRRPSDREPPRD